MNICVQKRMVPTTQSWTTLVLAGACELFITVIGELYYYSTCDSFISPLASRLPNLSYKCGIHISHINGLLGKGAWGGCGAGQSGTVFSWCPPKLEAGLKVWSPLCVIVGKPIDCPPRPSGPHNVLVTVRSDGSVQYSIYTWMQLHMHS